MNNIAKRVYEKKYVKTSSHGNDNRKNDNNSCCEEIKRRIIQQLFTITEKQRCFNTEFFIAWEGVVFFS